MDQRKEKRSHVADGVFIAIALAVFLLSAYKLYDYYAESRESEGLTEQVAKDAVTVQASVQQEPLVPEEEPVFVESAPISVDFDALWAENSDIVAWIYCEDTPINYPVVQAADNDFYLRRLIDGRWNMAGSLFVDFRNAADFSDWNTVIYGHHMKNQTMFGSLLSYKEQEYYDEHPVLYLLTPETDYKVEVLAGYVTPTTAEVYTFPMTEEDKEALVDIVREQSDFVSQTEHQAGDRLLTLSTCAYDYDDARYVLVGVLRELERQES